MGLVYFYHVLIMLDKELCVWGHGHPFFLILFLNFWGSCIYGQERALFRGWLVFCLCLLHLFWMYYSIFYPLFFCNRVWVCTRLWCLSCTLTVC